MSRGERTTDGRTDNQKHNALRLLLLADVQQFKDFHEPHLLVFSRTIGVARGCSGCTVHTTERGKIGV